MIRKILFAGLFCLFFQLAGFAFSENILNDIEYKKYGVSYPDESLSERLERLETDYFGMEQQGSIDSRINLLSKMSSNRQISAIQQPVYNDYQYKKKSAIRRFFDYFSDDGAMTGFIPSMTTSTYDNGSYYYSNGNNYAGNYGRNVFNNFFNGYKDNCPYHNHFNHNMSFSNNINRNRHNHLHNNAGYPYPHPNMYNYFPQNRIVRNFYIPPNVQSRSSVHIIKD